MRVLPFFSFATLCMIAGLTSACATQRGAQARPLSLAVAITPIGTRTISIEQVVLVHGALEPKIQQAGYSLASNRAAADFVLLVSFTPAPNGRGGHVKITGLEPTLQFLRSTDAGDTPEAKEMRRRQRELQYWIDRQSSGTDS